MYKINSQVDKPNVNELVNNVKILMHRGITLGDVHPMYANFLSQKDTLASEIYVNYGIKNPNSTAQIVEYLKSLDSAEVYECCYINNKWTTNKDVMYQLASLGYSFADDILEYRRVKKYAESIKSLIDAKSQTDGRIHPGITLTKTNRINYVSPALMNIPKTLLWDLIKPSKDGDVLISADIKNQEPNILFNMLKINNEVSSALTSPIGLYEYLFDKVFKNKAVCNLLIQPTANNELYKNSDLAKMPLIPPVIYIPTPPSVSTTFYNGRMLRCINVTNYGVRTGANPEDVKLPKTVIVETIEGDRLEVAVKWESIDKKMLSTTGVKTIHGELEGVVVNCTPEQRKEFKASWNAMTYGAGLPGVKALCKNINGEILYKYFSNIPELANYRNQCRKRADQGIQTATTYFGTELNANEAYPSRLKRILMDIPVQGTAADILSLLVRHINNYLVKNDLHNDIQIYYTRHDEIIFEASGNIVNTLGIERVKEIIQDMVEHQVDDWIPFKVEVNEIASETGNMFSDISEDFDDDIFG